MPDDPTIDPEFSIDLPNFGTPDKTYLSPARDGHITVTVVLRPHLSISENVACTEHTVVEALELLSARVRARILAAA